MDRKTIGDEIRAVQFGWPVGMPLLRKLDADLWEVRVRLTGRIARVIFTMVASEAVLLHGFFKTSQKTKKLEIRLAMARKSMLTQKSGR
jgi:phage-related protein